MKDEEEPRRPASVVVGAPLDDLSVGELDLRIGLLRAEIARLEAAKAAKQAAAAAALSFFKA